MGPNVDPCGIPNKCIWKTLSVSFIFAHCFLRLSMNVQKLLHPLVNRMLEVLEQVNHEEYSQ